jgi:hypothetical protein
MYRRPTVNDTIIPKDSFHSPEHKLAAIKYINNRVSTYIINKIKKENQTYYTIKNGIQNL